MSTCNQLDLQALGSQPHYAEFKSVGTKQLFKFVLLKYSALLRFFVLSNVVYEGSSNLEPPSNYQKINKINNNAYARARAHTCLKWRSHMPEIRGFH